MSVFRPPFLVCVMLTGCVSALASVARVSTVSLTRMLLLVDDARVHYEPNRPLWLANDDRR